MSQVFTFWLDPGESTADETSELLVALGDLFREITGGPVRMASRANLDPVHRSIRIFTVEPLVRLTPDHRQQIRAFFEQAPHITIINPSDN